MHAGCFHQDLLQALRSAPAPQLSSPGSCEWAGGSTSYNWYFNARQLLLSKFQLLNQVQALRSALTSQLSNPCSCGNGPVALHHKSGTSVHASCSY
jgi:hypothetical protein